MDREKLTSWIGRGFKVNNAGEANDRGDTYAIVEIPSVCVPSSRVG
jgi:hypothetical protein